MSNPQYLRLKFIKDRTGDKYQNVDVEFDDWRKFVANSELNNWLAIYNKRHQQRPNQILHVNPIKIQYRAIIAYQVK